MKLIDHRNNDLPLLAHPLDLESDVTPQALIEAVRTKRAQKLKTLLLPIGHQHDLTDHASASQQFVCVPRLAERQPLCDQRLDLLLLQ